MAVQVHDISAMQDLSSEIAAKSTVAHMTCRYCTHWTEFISYAAAETNATASVCSLTGLSCGIGCLKDRSPLSLPYP